MKRTIKVNGTDKPAESVPVKVQDRALLVVAMLRVGDWQMPVYGMLTELNHWQSLN
jgi:hypothetical protein